MAEASETLDKIDEVMDAIETKVVADSPAMPENSLTNSHGDEAEISKPNGEEKGETSEEKNEIASEPKATDAGKEETNIETTEPAATAALTDGEPAENKLETAPPADVTAAATASSADESNQEEMPVLTDDTAKKPAARGRGAPKGKRATGAKAKQAEASVPDIEPQDDKEKPEVVEPIKKDAEDTKAKASRKGTRNRGESAADAEAAKVPKNDHGDSSSDQQDTAYEKKTPLLETPLVIEGKRQRQKVERLDSKMLTATVHSKDATDLPQGSGAKLGDIAYIEAMISKTMAEDLKPLHRLCFGRVGQSHEIRKHLRLFCGFDFEKGSDPHSRKLKQVDNWSMKQLKKVCEVLGLERGGKKEDLQIAILEFLLKPSDAGKKVPQAKKRKGSVGGKKRGRSSGGRGKKRAAGGEPAVGSESDDIEEEESGGKGAGGSEDSEPEPPKAKRPRKAPQKKKETASSSKAPPRGKAASKTAKKSPPTDDALRATIKDLLQGANLEEITMRDMCRKVYAKYPDFDLSARKDFIKDAVKSIISSSGE